MTTSATGAPTSTSGSLPRAGSRSGIAPLIGDNAQLLHLLLFAAGAVLLPGGLIVIGLGWYGVAHTPYQYQQTTYMISGGVLGLGLTIVGGFLYFGAWLARVAADQKEASKKLSDTLLVLADAVAHASAQAQVVPVQQVLPQAAPQVVPPAVPQPVQPVQPWAMQGQADTQVMPAVAAPVARPAPPPPAAQRDPGSILVTAGDGTTLHRADCELLEGRDDLNPIGPDSGELSACRLCRPRG